MFVSFFLIVFIGHAHSTTAPPPNIIFLLTDDQDVSTLDYMPRLKSLMAEQGVTLNRMYASTPICCPSRSALWSGQYQHNNHVIGNALGTNCSSKTWQQLSEPNSVAVHLKAGGYTTSFAGKYLNDYGAPSVGGYAHVPAGWDNWHGTDASIYYDYTMSNNGKAEVHGHDYASDYLPDLVVNRTLAFLDANANSGKPIFAVVATTSCHDPEDPAPQYSEMFPGLTVPRTPAYNASTPGSHWLQADKGVYGFLTQDTADYLDLKFRRRVLTLISVEDMLEALIQKITDLGMLNNTYFVYTSDNGYHLGAYGIHFDKRQPWESDILLPFFIRGPGIMPGTVSDAIVSMPDLSATFLALAGVPLPPYFDGKSVLSKDNNDKLMALVEYHGEGNTPHEGGACIRTQHDPNVYCLTDTNFSTPPYWRGESTCSCPDSLNSTYNCLRFRNVTNDFRYCEFTDSVHMVEYFDYVADPYGLINMATKMPPSWKATLHNRLGEAIVCVGSQCHDILSQPL